jgi:hypothetical protein
VNNVPRLRGCFACYRNSADSAASRWRTSWSSRNHALRAPSASAGYEQQPNLNQDDGVTHAPMFHALHLPRNGIEPDKEIFSAFSRSSNRSQRCIFADHLVRDATVLARAGATCRPGEGGFRRHASSSIGRRECGHDGCATRVRFWPRLLIPLLKGLPCFACIRGRPRIKRQFS